MIVINLIFLLLWINLGMDAAFLIGRNDPPVSFLLLLFPGGILFLYWKSIMEPFLSIRKTWTGEEAEFDHQIHKLSREVFGKDLAVFIHECLELKTRKNNAEIFDKQSQLTALQTQINPHFLYNTLDTIRGMAMQHDIRDVSDVIGTLSSFFRYSISGKGSLVHIRDELKNINDYMKIQRYRFHDRFQLNIVVDEEDKRIFDFYIPRLILQPVVENAIVHGLDDVLENANVTIDITVADVLLITVSDNGIGMSLEELDALNAKIHSDDLSMLRRKDSPGMRHGTGIALPNINKRIILLYGKKYGLNVYSSEGHGTDVEIVLPIDNHGERNEQDLTKD